MNTLVFGQFAPLSSVYGFDVAPMRVEAKDVGSIHRVVFLRQPEAGGPFAPLVPVGSPNPPADASFIIDPRMFRVRPSIVQVSEATYHLFPDLKPPAAANTLPALLGLEVEGVALLQNASQVIPIAKLRDATNPRPLPFAVDPVVVADLKAAGVLADQFITLADGRTNAQLMNGFAQI